MTKESLLIFTRNLVYGNVKTRLAATVGNEVAFSVYKKLVQHTVSITSCLPVDKIVFYSECVDGKDMWSNEVYEKQLQTGNGLGERMQKAFADIFNIGYRKAVVIGTDCPELNSGVIMNAFIYLNHYDVAIGPAKDGGYYLLGMNKIHPQLFESISWSSDRVLQQTLDICEQLALTTYLLPELADIDDEIDFKNNCVHF